MVRFLFVGVSQNYDETIVFFFRRVLTHGGQNERILRRVEVRRFMSLFIAMAHIMIYPKQAVPD